MRERSDGGDAIRFGGVRVLRTACTRTTLTAFISVGPAYATVLPVKVLLHEYMEPLLRRFHPDRCARPLSMSAIEVKGGVWLFHNPRPESR